MHDGRQAGVMKSTKKRFKAQLAIVERMAEDLQWLAGEVALLDEVFQLASEVSRLAQILSDKAAECAKHDFAEHMRQEPAFARLESFVDVDLVSVVEERFAKASAGGGQESILALLAALLEKLERRYADLLLGIRQLSDLLNAD